MLIAFSKPKGVPVLTCVRDDGTTTYAKSAHGAFFGPHDLMHYAVETTLGFRDAFFGLIAKGQSIAWFSEPGAAAALPPEALYAEFIVNQLMQEHAFGTPSRAEEFNRTLAASAAQAKGTLPPPRALTDEDLGQIRATFARLLHQYQSMGTDERIELTFP